MIDQIWILETEGLPASEDNPCSFSSLEVLEGSLRISYSRAPSPAKILDLPGYKEWKDFRGLRMVARPSSFPVGRLIETSQHL